MQARDELEWLRQRASALEQELAELKARLERWETLQRADKAMEVAPESVPPVSAVVTPGLPEREPELVEAVAQDAPPPLPPVLTVAAAVGAGAPDQPAHQTEPRVGVRENPLREWLEPLQLWPPRGEENTEVRLGAWWATRLGALLAVIGIVFLGIYVSRNSAPWVRLAEVMAVTAGVLGLGGWLERKLPKFGAVVFGAGLALAYFCAFAAYGVAPMKVIESSAVAIACELAVVGGIFAVAWWRGSTVVATMAVALGHVTAFLALRGGPPGFGPWVVLLLGVAAVTLRLARGWGAPSALAMPLAWVFLATATVKAVATAGVLSLAGAWAWAILYFSVFFLRDLLFAWRGSALERSDRGLQVANSSLAFAVGWLVTAQVGGERLTTFYFGASGVMLLATIAWRRTVGGETLVPVFACKTAGMLGLGVIATFEGHARYLVLLTQAWAMLAAARQSHVRGLRLATAIAGGVALGFFMAELRPEYSNWRDRATALEALFLAGAIGFVAAMRRLLALDPAKSALGAVVVAVAAISAATSWETAGWLPAVLVGVGVGLVGTAVRSGLVAAVAGAMLLVAAHVAQWGFEVLRYGSVVLWANEATLLLATAAGMAAIWRWGGDDSRWRNVELVLALLAGATLVVVGAKAFPPGAALASAAGVTGALAFLAGGRARLWSVLGAPLLGLGLALYVVKGARGGEVWLWLAAGAGWLAVVRTTMRTVAGDVSEGAWARGLGMLHAALATVVTLLAIDQNVSPDGRALAASLAALGLAVLAWRPGVRAALECSWVLGIAALLSAADQGASRWNAVAFAVAWLPALGMTRWPGWEVGLARDVRRASAVQVTLATLMGLVIAIDVRDAAWRLGALGGVALVCFGVWRWGRVAAAQFALLAMAAVVWVAAWLGAASPAAQGWSVALAATVLAGLGIAVLPLVAAGELTRRERERFRWSASAAGVLLMFYTLWMQRGPVADYITVGWGATAVATFLLGLFARSRPHRLVGLAGLAGCVPRAFLVDIDSTLYRIVAFVALGVVLLWVGFSYHRFRHLISEDDKKL